MHDDQHGTAVVTLAALMNATRYSGESLKLQKVGIVGLGAAGMGIAKLLKAYGVKVITGSDINPEANELFEQDVGPTSNLEELMKKFNRCGGNNGRTSIDFTKVSATQADYLGFV